jgi:hypothetical protein
LTVLGRYEDARSCCLALARVAPEWVVVTASASVASLTGQAERAREALLNVLATHPSVPATEKRWTLTILAETCARMGKSVEAELHFRSALALGGRDVYLLGAFADFMLAEGRFSEAVALLSSESRVDSLLLRLAIAESRLRPVAPSLSAHVTTLQARFDDLRLRGDRVHLREEAQFALSLLNRPADALRLAEANWSVQREPADVRILLEAALGAQRPEAAAEGLRFARINKLEDGRIRELSEQLQFLLAGGHRSAPTELEPGSSPSPVRLWRTYFLREPAF